MWMNHAEKKMMIFYQVVSGVKINDAKNFLMESKPHKYNFRSLWWSSSKIQKMPFTPPRGVGCQKNNA